MSLVWLCVLVSIICEAHSQMFMSFINCGSLQMLALQTILCPSAFLRYSQERPGPHVVSSCPCGFQSHPLCSSLLVPPLPALGCTCLFRLYFTYHTSLLMFTFFSVVFPFCTECFHTIF